jgi:Ca2+-binding RTX toxin-like protein
LRAQIQVSPSAEAFQATSFIGEIDDDTILINKTDRYSSTQCAPAEGDTSAAAVAFLGSPGTGGGNANPGNGNDRVFGSNSNDIIGSAHSGNDILRGYEGADSIEGGPGADFHDRGWAAARAAAHPQHDGRSRWPSRWKRECPAGHATVDR